jgi:serine phosphatase RsbU (regulator of sigma subunit)
MAREIIALRSGKVGRQFETAERPLHDALVDTISDLYDSLGTRTFEMVELNHQLQVYHDRQEEENALAQSIILRLIQREGLSSPQLHYWFVPAAVFSGDIVAAVHAPGGRVYTLLADATGHGLAAAITALPVLSVFYTLAERGCPLGEILAEINRNLRATLPGDRFVASTILYVDGAEGTAEIWNGGMPDVLLLDSDGHIVQTVASSQLPLGIVDFTADMSATTRIAWKAGCQFAMYSDGLIEAGNTAGEQFGVERLGKAFLSAPAGQRIDAVKEALSSHVGAAVPHDDITLMLVDCISS